MEKCTRFIPCALMLGLLIIGCDTATNPADTAHVDETSPPYQPSTIIGDPPPDGLRLGVFRVCKSAPDDTSRAFPFEVTVQGPNADRATVVPFVELADDTCADVYALTEPSTDTDEVAVTENVPAQWRLDSVIVHRIDSDGSVTTHEAAGPEITEHIAPDTRGVLATYHNAKVPNPPGDDDGDDGDDGDGDDGNGDDDGDNDSGDDNDDDGDDGDGDDGDGDGDDGDGDGDGDDGNSGEGCTPGAWKNRLLRLERWPVSEDTRVDAVWNVPESLAGATLLDALRFGGGPSFEHKVRILLRAATAAYLNAQTIAYDLTTQQVVDEVNAAIAQGDAGAVIMLAEEIDRFNNQDCPITERNYGE